MTDIPRRYENDPDANVVYPITDANGADVDWASPSVTATKSGVSATVACTWLGSAAPTRNLKVPVDTLAVGTHSLRLVVPNENDIPLGRVSIVAV